MAENIIKHIFSVDPTAEKKNRRSGVRREGRGKGIGSFHVSKSRRQYEINKSIITELERNSYFHFEMRFPMWAMSIKEFIAKYDKPGAILDSHDVLRAEGLLQKMSLDEKKDVIFVKGFNVFPREIEEQLMSLPNVSSVCVVAKQDDRSGETPVAFITLKRQLDVSMLKKHCEENLLPYKVPSDFIVLESLPLTPAKKIDRAALKNKLI